MTSRTAEGNEIPAGSERSARTDFDRFQQFVLDDQRLRFAVLDNVAGFRPR